MTLNAYTALKGLALSTSDGIVGRVDDLCFDDRNWKVQYLVIECGRFWSSRRVLLPATALVEVDWTNHQVHTSWSSAAVQEGEHPDLAPTVRQTQESESGEFGLASFYPGYLAGMEQYPPGLGVYEVAGRQRQAPSSNPGSEYESGVYNENPEGLPLHSGQARPSSHLRSAEEIISYAIEGTEGLSGYLSDLLIDALPRQWQVSGLVVQSGNWLAPRKVELSPQSVREINWHGQCIGVDLSRDQIRDSKFFDAAFPINRELHRGNFDYYGRPRRTNSIKTIGGRRTA